MPVQGGIRQPLLMGAACGYLAFLFQLATVAKRGVTKAPLTVLSSTFDLSTSEELEFSPKMGWKVKTKKLD